MYITEGFAPPLELHGSPPLKNWWSQEVKVYKEPTIGNTVNFRLVVMRNREKLKINKQKHAQLTTVHAYYLHLYLHCQ